MKILIVSDTHRKQDNLYTVFRREKDFQAFIHLGDAEGLDGEITRELGLTHPLCPAKFIRGNCDDDIRLPLTDAVSYGPVKFFMTHGHRLQVGTDPELSALSFSACENGCSSALFGHTHRPLIYTAANGVVCVNPGSVSEPRTEDRRASYCMAEIGPDGHVSFELRYL